MPFKNKKMEEEPEDDDTLIEDVGVVTGEEYDIRVQVRQYKGSAPTLRLNRVGTRGRSGTPFIKALGSLKSPREVEGLVRILPAAGEALERALAQDKRRSK